MKLNEEQTLAVTHPLGKPACLIAGAGSGKTATMTARVKWLMEQGTPPRRIVAVTFTNKAANELLSRLGLNKGDSGDIPRVSTIHSLALSGIRKNPQAFGLKDKVTPLDDYDQKQMVKKIIDRHKFEEDTTKLMFQLLEKISFHRARGIGFRREYTDDVHEQALKMHAGYHAMDETELDLWAEFETEKLTANTLDFDDMVHMAVRRMRTDSRWLAKLHQQFDHILVDEMQDTSPVQFEFVNGLLAPSNMNLYLVGDLNQSIYSFNGAVPEIMRSYSENWRGVRPTLYKIQRNHRSVPEIVDFSNLICSKMKMTIPIKMESWRGTNNEQHGEVRKMVAAFPQGIAAMIAQEIARDSRKGIPYKDNALLVRAAIQIRDLESELIRRRIPYVVRGGRGLLATEEVRDLMAYIRLAANHKDFMALCRAAGAPRCGVGEVGLEKLRILANEKYEGDLIQVAKDNRKLSLLRDTIEHVSLFKDNPVAAVEKIVAMMNYKEYVRQKYKKEPGIAQSKLENIERFAMMVIMLVQEGNLSLDDLIFNLTLDRPKGDEGEEREAVLKAFEVGKITTEERDNKLQVIDQGSVIITTIHSAKGLEFRRVYVTNMVEGSLPHRFSSGSDEEIEEERRLAYVACTRAKDFLVLCVHEKEQRGDRVLRVYPSRFLTEIGA